MFFNSILNDGEILSAKELLVKLNLKVEDNIRIEHMTWDEFEDMFPEIWTYPLDEITHIIEEGNYVYICKFDDGTVRYVEDQNYSHNKPLFSKDFDIIISYEQDTNTLVVNKTSNICTGVRYYLNDRSEVGLRVQNYIDYVMFEKERK